MLTKKEKEILRRGERLKRLKENKDFIEFEKYINKTLETNRSKMEYGLEQDDYNKLVGECSGLRKPLTYIDHLIKQYDEINKRIVAKSKQ